MRLFFLFIAIFPILLKAQQPPFENPIATVMINKVLNNNTVLYHQNIINLSESNAYLVLEFDDLTASYRQFHFKILPRNKDWSATNLRDLEFLNDYNEFIINQYEVSQGTKVPYYHYATELPRPKLAGNYLIQVFDGSLDGLPVLERKFFVLDQQISIAANITRASDPALFQTHQGLEMELSYGNYPVNNPRQDFSIEIVQNYHYQARKSNFQPSRVDISKRKLFYSFFANENLFKAGNEFRNVNLTSTYTGGNNVARIIRGEVDQVYLVPQENRAVKTYLNAFDQNGQFFVNSLEDQHHSISADYVMVEVGLKSYLLRPGQEIGIVGLFNNFEVKDYLMKFDEKFQGYIGKYFWKQGIYDFQFAITNGNSLPDTSPVEGDFKETGNTYEIFIYHRPPTSRIDKLVGYQKIQ